MFCTLQCKYDATVSNSHFASVLHQIPKVPEGYKPEHLRLQLVRSVVVTRDSLRGIIREDLIRYGRYYRQSAEELADVSGPFLLKPALKSLRLLLGIPVALYRAYPSQKQDRGKKKEYTVKVWYPFSADKDLDVNFKFINLANNGLDYIVPAVDMNIHRMNTKFSTITESINTGIV